MSMIYHSYLLDCRLGQASRSPHQWASARCFPKTYFQREIQVCTSLSNALYKHTYLPADHYCRNFLYMPSIYRRSKHSACHYHRASLPSLASHFSNIYFLESTVLHFLGMSNFLTLSTANHRPTMPSNNPSFTINTQSMRSSVQARPSRAGYVVGGNGRVSIVREHFLPFPFPLQKTLLLSLKMKLKLCLERLRRFPA